MMKKMEKIEDPQNREKLFREIRIELDAHAHMEEKSFYPRMKHSPETKDITLESYEEHHVVKLLLNELDDLPKYRDEWLAKFIVLKENVEHHIKEEEEDFFPKAKKILGKKSEELGEEMEKAKQQYLNALRIIS